MSKKTVPPDSFLFHQADRIGVAAAEDDDEFLKTCFVDTGDTALLEDISDNRIIVLGRTGAGKSALFEHLKGRQGDRIIDMKPDSLALTYVGHSTILNTYASIGINLDPFFSLLWRHILTVEILRRYFQAYVNKDNLTLWEWLISYFTGRSREHKEMKEAIEYLRDWGEEFWLETEYRVKEITEKMELELTNAIKANLGNKYASLGTDAREMNKLTAEEKLEVQRLGQAAVSKAQVKDLHNVLRLLDKILEDRQKQYYIIVDGLDENWVEEKLRYRLIMALIQTAKEFIKVDNAKVIIALRRDLIDRVFRLARQAGFQEEKFVSLYREVKWDKSHILEVLDRRVRYLVRRRYTKVEVTYTDLLPKAVRGLPIDDFIFSVAPRPRDVIAFFNACILQATDQPNLSNAQLSAAITDYSMGRLRALADEWSADCPYLIEFSRILATRQSHFKLETVTISEVENLCLEVVSDSPNGTGLLHESAAGVLEQLIDARDFLTLLFNALFRVGLVGFKMSSKEHVNWVGDSCTMPTKRAIENETNIFVAPSYIRALRVKDKIFG